MLMKGLLTRGFARRLIMVKNPFEYSKPADDQALKQVEEEKAATLEVQKAKYLSPIRKAKYHGSVSLGEQPKTLPKRLFQEIEKADNPEALLNLYMKQQFYCGPAHVISFLAQFSIVFEQYMGMKRNMLRKAQNANMLHKLGGIKHYDASSDSRLASLLNHLYKSAELLSPAECVKATWVLAKCDKIFESKNTADKILRNVIGQSLALVSFKDLGVLVWSLGKLNLKRREHMGSIALEFERRVKVFLELKQEMFVKIDKKGRSQNSDSKEAGATKGNIEASDPSEAMEEPDFFEAIEDRSSVPLDDLRPHEKISVQSVCLYFWGIAKLNAIDTDMAEPLFRRLIDEDILSHMNLVQLQMVLPSVAMTAFPSRHEAISVIYARLAEMLEEKVQSESEVGLLDNTLALKTTIVQLPPLFKMVQPPDRLFTALLVKFVQEEHAISPRFCCEVLKAVVQAQPQSLPPSFCRKVEVSAAKHLDRMQIRDIVDLVYSLGKLIQRKQTEERFDMGFDMNAFLKLLVNELSLKKPKMDSRHKSMIREVKPFIAKHCAAIRTVIE